MNMGFSILLHSKWLLALAALVLSGFSLNGMTQDKGFEHLVLNGLAPFVQLRKEYYIGGLYLQALSGDSGAVVSRAEKKRLEMRITIDKWSSRRFAQQWNQSILINNDQKSLEQFAKQILAFTNMARDELVAGDRIIVNLDPANGTTVYLNRQQVLNVNNSGFFQLLLNTWVGQRPPSSDFKRNILTLPQDQAGTELLARYQSLSTSKTRERKTASWFIKDTVKTTPTAIEQNKTATATDSDSDTDTDTTSETASYSSDPQPAAAVARVTSPAELSAQIEENQQPVTNSAAGVESSPELTVTSTTADASASAIISTATSTNSASVSKPTNGSGEEPPSTETDEQSSAANLANTVQATDTDTDTDSETAKDQSQQQIQPAPQSSETKETALAKFEQEQQSLFNNYRSNILKLAYLNTQYPKRAMDFKQQGKVILNVRINRSGKLIEVLTADNSTKYKLLTKAAIKAVEKTAPFPELPRDLAGNEIELSLPFNFKL